MHFFLATDLTFHDQDLDEGENIHLVRVTEKAMQKKIGNEVVDMKTVLGYHLVT
jgi:hypothetical protein